MSMDLPNHPFRFGVQVRNMGPRQVWLDTVRRIETLGYSSFLVLDHFVRGLDPIAALAAAAIASPTLRLGSMVFDNDFRHPATLAKAAATIDVLSDGRLELGIGAGWLREEYDQTGIPFDSPGKRIDRMAEAIHLIKQSFGEERTTFTGEHYEVTDLLLPPKPIQKPHPPIVIGGGSKRILTIAGREADIVGITTRAMPDGSKDTEDMTAEATDRKIGWIRDAAGDRFSELELTTMATTIAVTNDRQGVAGSIAGKLGLTAEQVLASPQVLIGSVDEIVNDLHVKRERFGISYIVVLNDQIDALAPFVGKLTGK